MQSFDIYMSYGRDVDWLSGEKDFAEGYESASHRSIAGFGRGLAGEDEGNLRGWMDIDYLVWGAVFYGLAAGARVEDSGAVGASATVELDGSEW